MSLFMQWPVLTFIGMTVAFGVTLLLVSVTDNLKAGPKA